MRLSEAVRPPEHRIVDDEIQLLDGTGPAAYDVLTKRQREAALPLHVGFAPNTEASVRQPFLVNSEGTNAGRILNQRDALPDAAGDEPRTPVPSGHVLRFTDESPLVKTLDPGGEALRLKVAGAALLPHVYGGSEVHAQFVLALPQAIGDVHLQGQEHIVVLGDRLAIQDDLANGVQPLEAENTPRQRR